LSFQGYCNPISAFSSNGVLIDNISDNSLLANAGGFLRDKSIYCFKCKNLKVINSKFDNANFAVYLSGDGTTQTSGALVAGNSFDQTAAAGSFTALFPVGVYVYYANDVVVRGNSFKNIYSSFDNGSTGTGMGYGIYEGDGACTKILVSGNTFQYDQKGVKNAIGVLVSKALQATVNGNNFRSEALGQLTAAIYSQVDTDGADRIIEGNSIKMLATTGWGVYATGASTTNIARYKIASNIIFGGSEGIRIDGTPASKYDIQGNAISNQTATGIRLQGLAGSPVKFPLISNNSIQSTSGNGIFFAAYVISPSVIGNTILDGNKSNTAGDSGAAIFFSSYSYGSYIANNIIGNTVAGGGLFTFGVQNAANAADRMFKDITPGNSFIGLSNSNQFGYYFNTIPTNGIYDINKGDYIHNWHLAAGGAPGWYCVYKLTPTLTADASNASTTVTVSSTSSMVAGMPVLLVKNANAYAGDYYTNGQSHIDTIASVTDGTHFVLTNGIPVGDGTYVAGTAIVISAMFKAAASIAP
jgi:hypothetical protein